MVVIMVSRRVVTASLLSIIAAPRRIPVQISTEFLFVTTTPSITAVPVSILVPELEADSVFGLLRSKPKDDASSDDHEKVWQSHSSYRARLPSGRSGVKDIPVVLFRIVRGSAK